jgi:hypothetical protein
MSRVCGVLAATSIAAGLVVFAASACAEDLTALEPAADERAEAADDLPGSEDELFGPPQNILHLHQIDRFLFFGGVDLWRNGAFGHGGMLWSPGGLNREGFTLKLLLAGGVYRYHTDRQFIAGRQLIAIRQHIIGRQELISVMAGWRFKRDNLDVALFLGPDLQSHVLMPDDPGNRMRGIRAGVRVGGDMWYQPSSHMMFNVGVSASTIGNSYWSRAAFGWYLAGMAWIGPEVIGLGGGNYTQLRLGLHATALRFGAFDWSLGAGYAHDNDDRGGVYARIGMSARQ